MRTRYVLGAWLAALVLLASGGCASTSDAADQPIVFKATGVASIEKADRVAGVPALDWDTVVSGTGHGLPASETARADIRRMHAIEAARQLALTDLVTKLKGVQVRQQTRVRNMTFAGQEVESQVSGELSGVRTVKSSFDEATGMATVTLEVGLDSEGNIVPDRLLPMTPFSVAVRRVRAEQAAKVDAVAKLREQLGDVYVGQTVKVKNLQLSHQEAWLLVDGILQGVRFSRPLWPSETECRVEATLEVAKEQMAELRQMVRPVR